MATAAAAPPEAWERLAARVAERLARWPLAVRALHLAQLACLALVLLAILFVDDVGHGVRVWPACLLMLLAWTALLPTRTLRWTSVARLFAVTAVWSVVVAWLSLRWSDTGRLTVNSHGPRIAIAGIVEETFKLLPLAVFAAVAPGRVRRFGVADWIAVGLACGMGFQAAEDIARQIVYVPTIRDILSGRPWLYGWTLFGGEFRSDGVASYAGHHIATGLVAAGLGIAAHVTLRHRRGRRLVWLLPAALWLLVVVDHMGFNAAVSDRRWSTADTSSVPGIVHTLWSLTANGRHRGWLLLALVAVALAVDARTLRPATGPPASSTAAPHVRVLAWLRAAATALADDVRLRVRAALAAVRQAPAGVRSRAGAAWATLDAHRRARQRALTADHEPGRRATRIAAGVTGIAAAVVAQQAATALARRIGRLVNARDTAWFADVLEALLDWWNDLPPGGKGMVLLGAAALVIGTGLVLMPTVAIGGGIAITGTGALVGTTIVVPAGVTTAVGVTVVGAGTVMMATGGASGTGGGSDPPGGSGARDGDPGGPDPHDPARLDELARDPAQGGRITDKTRQEARVGLDLEARGDLPGPIRRDPTGGAEFTDASGQYWDVKGFTTDYPNGYRLDDAMAKIRESIRDGEHVIVDTSKMNPSAVGELRGAIDELAEWGGKVLWWP